MHAQRPNLFDYATSELSQDAFLCWLLKWADPTCREFSGALHEAGVDLIRLLSAGEEGYSEKINTVCVEKQVDHIDVLCVLNEQEETKAAILIEDKKGTQEHSDQLQRYKELLSKGFPQDRIIAVYVQTDDQSDYGNVRSHGYDVVSRPDLLAVLEKCREARSESDILDGFVRHLRSIEDEVQSWQSKHPTDWSWSAWKGFYMELQRMPSVRGGWGYVPVGDFLGYWFGDWDAATGIDETWMHIDNVKETLCFRIAISHSVSDTGQRYALRDQWSGCIIARCKELQIPARRPQRFGRISAGTLTVAEIDREGWLMVQDGLVDVGATVTAMEKCLEVVRHCVKRNGSHLG